MSTDQPTSVPPFAYFATRTDSARDEVIAILSSVSEGYGSDETGDVDAPTGHFALVILDASCDLDFADHTNYPVGDEAGEVARMYGVTAGDVMGAHIVTTDSQGFVDVTTYATEDAAREAFACLAGRFDEWDREDEDSDEDSAARGDGVYVCPVAGHGYHQL